MKNHYVTLILSWLLPLLVFSQKQYSAPIPFDSTLYEGKLTYLSETKKTSIEKRPNIILIVADDLGKFDLSIYGNPYIQTPNIDAIGHNGILFNKGYSTAAVCSPSRAGFITGRYQQRFGFHIQPHQRYANNKFELWAFQRLINTSDLNPEDYQPYPSKEERKKMGLPQSEITIAEILQQNGYRTALTGKWHLGYHEPLLPKNFGFDYSYGFYEAYSLFANPKDKNIVNARIKEFTDKVIWRGGRKGACAIYENGEKIKEEEYLTYAFFRQAKKFISEGTSDQPFFVYLPVNAPHTPYQAPKAIYDQLTSIQDHHKRVYYSMIITLDNAVGDLVEYLKENDLYDNTLLIFTSDNGAALYSGTVDNLPLNAGKFTLFEGGINIPFMMHLPNAIQTPQEIHESVSLLDLVPTIADVAHASLPTDRVYDGNSLTTYFTNNSAKGNDTLFWYSDYNSAIQIGDYKLILNDLDSTVDLYNLKEDPYEKNNLSANSTEVERLKIQLEEWKSKLPKMYWPRIMNYEVEINGKKYRWAV